MDLNNVAGYAVMAKAPYSKIIEDSRFGLLNSFQIEGFTSFEAGKF